MPGSLTSSANNAVANTASNTPGEGGVAVPILQGLMEGQGWHDQRGEILAHDQQEALIVGRSKQAAADYDAAPTAVNHAALIAALMDELTDLESQRDHAQTQQHHYETQAKKAAKEQASHSQGWGEWFKSWVVTTPEQQAKEQVQKYAEVAAIRQARIDQLQPVLLQLISESVQTLPELMLSLEEAEQVDSEEEITEVLSSLSKKQRSENRQPIDQDNLATAQDADAMPQSHSRRLLQTGSEEFQVNSYTTSSQGNPSIAVLTTGDFVIIWESDGQDSSGYGIYAQRYAASGTLQGSEFRINTYTASIQEDPAVAALTNGNFVVAWMSKGQDGNLDGIYAQRYAANGTPLGVEFRANSYTASDQRSPSVGGSSNGDFVVAWHSWQDGSEWGVYAQRYAANGTPQGVEFRVNTYTTLDQSEPGVSVLTNGDFVIAWHSNGQDGDGYGVYAKRYAANGIALGSEFRVNTYTISHQLAPSVAALANGDFVVAWMSTGQDGSVYGIYAQRYAANGTPLGVEFRANSYTASDQQRPKIGALTSGDFVIAWHSNGQDGDLDGVYAQHYAVNGALLGTEFRVNTYISGQQSAPSIGAFITAGFVIAWQSYLQDGDGYGVYARLYSPPTFINNRLTVSEGGSAIFTSNELSASDSFNSSLLFSISNLQHGAFNRVSNGSALTQFAQPEIAAGEVRFVHDGGELPPSYNVSVSNGQLTAGPSAPSPLNFTNINDAPAFINNRLTVSEGGSIVLSSNELSAGDVDSTTSSLVFTVSNPQHATFQRVSNNASLTQFTQQDITSGQVRFVHDGGELAPSYNVSVNDGQLSIGPFAPSPLNFTNINDAPIFINNRFTISEGGSIVLSNTELSASDVDSSNSSLLFTVSNLQHAAFQRVSNNASLTQFTQQDIADGQVRLVHDGGELPPAYNVSVSDGQLTAGPLVPSFNFTNINDAPILGNNRLTISEGGSAILSSNELSASDVDSSNSSLVFTVSNLQHAAFQRVSNNASLTQFTQQDIAGGQVRLLHDGGELPPTYSVRVGDGQLTAGPMVASPINFTNVNDAPIFINNKLSVAKGSAKVLTSQELSASDVDSDNASLLFAISNLQHGAFNRVSNNATLTQFTQQDIADGEVRFTHDGSALPGYNVSVSDGQLTTGPFAQTVNFLSSPKSSALPIALIAGAGAGGIAALCLLYILYRYKNQQTGIGRPKAPKAKDVASASRLDEAEQGSEVELFSVDVAAPKVSIDNSVVDKTHDKAPAKSEADKVAIAIKPALLARPKAQPVPSIEPVSPPSDPDSESKKQKPNINFNGEITFNLNIPYSELQYNKKDKLGSGAYGTVYQGTYRSHDVAIKKLKADYFSEKVLAELRQEASIMASIHSSYIVQLQGVCLQPPNFCLVMELMPKGSLYNVLRNGHPLALSEVYNIAIDVAYGLRDLHKGKILHRDLKSLNVLLDDRFRAKISDFGLSKIKTEMTGMSSTEAMVGTLSWMAPELFGKGESAQASQASDIYSYGMVLWEMLNKPYRTPFQGLPMATLLTAKLTNGSNQEEIPADCPEPMAELLLSCWKPEAKARPSAEAVAKSLNQLFAKLPTEATARPAAPKVVEAVEPEVQSEVPGYLSNLQSS